MSYRSSIIRSIERGTISLGSGETTKTATLSTPVDPAVSYVSHHGTTVTTTSMASVGNGSVAIQLTDLSGGNWTKVTATRLGDGAVLDTAVVAYEVVQYVGGILKSAPQQVGITLSALTTATAALSPAVVTARTVLVPGGMYTNSTASNGGGELWSTMVLTNTTTVTATRVNATDNMAVFATAVEYR